MTAIANAVIEKVYEGPSGVSSVGPWQIYNFKVEGRDEKFTYFGGEGKAVPRVGMMLEVIQYTTEQNEGKDGKIYDNHTVKKLQTGQSATPPPHVAQHGAQDPKKATQVVTVNRNSTNIQVALNGICHGAEGIVKCLGQNPKALELADACIAIYEHFKEFADNYREDLYQIQHKMDGSGIPDDFWAWLVKEKKVGDRNDLTPTTTAFTLNNWGKVVKWYIDSTKPVKSEQIQQEVKDDRGMDEGNREFERQMEKTPGPGDTKFPDTSEPRPEDLCPW